jgi:hypothetical protein
MKRHVSVVMILVLVMIGMLLPLSVGAASKYRAQMRDSTVHASSWEFDECVESGVSLSASHSDVKQHSPPGRPETFKGTAVWLYIVEYDWCTGDISQSIFGYAELPASSLVVDKQLGRATLNATVTAYDEIADEELTLDIAMEWEAFGPKMTGHGTSHFRGSGFSYHSRWHGTFRDAVASGTILDNGTNYAPDMFEWAMIGQSRGGWMEMIK